MGFEVVISDSDNFTIHYNNKNVNVKRVSKNSWSIKSGGYTLEVNNLIKGLREIKDSKELDWVQTFW